jgi:KDO2-lipid IV(A) lauroyltransferase
MLWEESEQKYVLHFGDEIELARTDNDESDMLSNTAKFTAVIESYVKRYPDQWLWVHRRWKTRPEGEERVY